MEYVGMLKVKRAIDRFEYILYFITICLNKFSSPGTMPIQSDFSNYISHKIPQLTDANWTHLETKNMLDASRKYKI